jgi:hypothetical protein
VQAELVVEDQYEDQQFQNPDDIPPQAPIPPGIHEIDLYWDKKRGWMRIDIGDQAWWFKEYLGRCQVISTQEKGRINIRAGAQIAGETLTMWRSPDATAHPLVDGTRRRLTHNRLCYRRAQRDWRVNDDGSDQNGFGNRIPDTDSTAAPERKLVYVQSYVGDLLCLWNKNDTVAHIYHDGNIIIDDNNIAHLYDPLIR